MSTINEYYPVAGCAPLNDVDAAPYHLRWAVTDDAGQILLADHCKLLTDISVTLSFGYLVMRAPGMLRMDIPLDVIEDDDSVVRQAHLGQQPIKVVDEGDLAAAWVSNFLGQKSRLVKIHPDAPALRWPE